MNKEDNPLKCGSYEPSMYGIVNGYKYDEVMIEDNYSKWISKKEFYTRYVG